MIIYNKNSNGGTEIQSKKLSSRIPEELLSKFQITTSEDVDLDNLKIRILYLHSTAYEVFHPLLENNNWKKFHKIIFVSYHQMEAYVREYSIPYSLCVVMHNALQPVKLQPKYKDKISLIYTSTPYRGLDILLNVFERLCEEYDNLELKVHSSFEVYGEEWSGNQQQYKQSELYQRLEAHPKINNIGYVKHKELMKSLASSHIFAYPCIWRETFCLSLLEAMSAGLLCIHPNYVCLPETASNWTMMYPFDEDMKVHEEKFYRELKKAIKIVKTQETQEHLKKQKEYVDYLFNWERRTQDWIELLQSLEHLNPKIPKNISFNYS